MYIGRMIEKTRSRPRTPGSATIGFDEIGSHLAVCISIGSGLRQDNGQTGSERREGGIDREIRPSV
jgi:hypothetical protein